MIQITGEYDYVMGHLRYGTLTMNLSEEKAIKFKNSTFDEQKEWLEEEGELEIDYEIEDRGNLKITINET